MRLEQLYPLPEKKIKDLIATYPNAKEIHWAQEEPRNMGAAYFIKLNLPVEIKSLITPPASASTAAGSPQLAAARQEELLNNIFNA